MGAIETAAILPVLLMVLVNVFDIASYIYQRLEVENAAQMGVQAIWRACDPSMVPATLKCPSLTAAVTAAIQSTTLGSAVALQSGSPSEGYYCLDAQNALQFVSDVSNRPANCSATGRPSLRPADYIMVQVSYSYTPVFSGISTVRLLPNPIVKTARMRLG